MAVYTHINQSQLNEFLDHYDAGALKSFQGIEQGVENSNYRVETDKGPYILTLYEKRTDPSDLPFFFAFTDHLNKNKIACPRVIRDKDGGMMRALGSRPAALISFLEGKDLGSKTISAGHCGEIGIILAKMHKAALTFGEERNNSLGLAGWKDIAARTAGRADTVEPGLARLIAQELLFLERNWPGDEDLPRGAVHADLFPDNVFFQDGKVCGVIDFYFSCTDFLAYDLALVINAWCFDTKNQMDAEKLGRLCESYNKGRKMKKTEKEAMNIMARGAAMRIMLTRLHDWVFPHNGALVKPKDPKEYLAKLKWHQDNQIEC